jgi:hypothetical protein
MSQNPVGEPAATAAKAVGAWATYASKPQLMSQRTTVALLNSLYNLCGDDVEMSPVVQSRNVALAVPKGRVQQVRNAIVTRFLAPT